MCLVIAFALRPQREVLAFGKPLSIGGQGEFSPVDAPDDLNVDVAPAGFAKIASKLLTGGRRVLV
jgi:hypothetical protein